MRRQHTIATCAVNYKQLRKSLNAKIREKDDMMQVQKDLEKTIEEHEKLLAIKEAKIKEIVEEYYMKDLVLNLW